MTEIMVQENTNVIARAELDTMISTAKAYPRDVKQCVEEAIAMATMDEETAQACVYALPRKDKDGNRVDIKGASIRLAEICASSWGNIHAATRIVEVSEKHIVTEGVCWDLQKNVKVTMPDKVSIWFGEKGGKGGYRANNDMQVMLSKASCSKALRNAIFRVVPGFIVQAAYNKALEMVAGDVKTLANRTKAVIEKLVKMGISKEDIFNYYEHTKFDEFTAEDYTSLIGIGTALKEKRIKIEEIFSIEKDESTNISASDRINNLLLNKSKPKIDHVDASTGEVIDGA